MQSRPPSSAAWKQAMLPTISPVSAASIPRELRCGLVKWRSQVAKNTSRVRGLVPAMSLDSGSDCISKSAGKSAGRVGRRRMESGTALPARGSGRCIRHRIDAWCAEQHHGAPTKLQPEGLRTEVRQVTDPLDREVGLGVL